MLAGKKLVLVGGDARQLAMVERFRTHQAEVSFIGWEQTKRPPHDLVVRSLTPASLAEADALILPVGGADAQGRVRSAFCSALLQVRAEHIAALPDHARVFIGMPSPLLEQFCRQRGVRLEVLMERDDIAIQNAIPTAEGALSLAIQHTPYTLHGARCLVLGAGRVGFVLAQRLGALGAQVTVVARRSAARAQAEMMGWKSCDFSQLDAALAATDILFNTVPALVIAPPQIDLLPRHTLILDLASKPGGVDHAYAAQQGLASMLAPALPGSVAPQTAGWLLADAIVDCLSKAEGENAACSSLARPSGSH